MGLIVALVVLLINALIWWLMGGTEHGISREMFWAMGIVSVLGLIPNFLFGHRGFGGGGNTDMMLYLAIIGIGAAVFIP